MDFTPPQDVHGFQPSGERILNEGNHIAHGIEYRLEIRRGQTDALWQKVSVISATDN
jgi:hypothetical protein